MYNFYASFLYLVLYSYYSSNYCNSDSCHSFIYRAIEKRGHESIYKTYKKTLSKKIKSNNFCYHILERAITKLGGKEKSPILLAQYWNIKKSFCLLGAPILLSPSKGVEMNVYLAKIILVHPKCKMFWGA